MRPVSATVPEAADAAAAVPIAAKPTAIGEGKPVQPASVEAPTASVEAPTAPTPPVGGAAEARRSPMAPAAERVDWTAILEERALVPDSEAGSAIAEAVVVPGDAGRRRGLMTLLIAVTALFSVVASAAVVVALLRDDDPAKGDAARAAAGDEDDEDHLPPDHRAPPPTEPAPSTPAAPVIPPPPEPEPAATPPDEPEEPADAKPKKAEKKPRADRTERDKGRPAPRRGDDVARGGDSPAGEKPAGEAPADGEPKAEGGDRPAQPAPKDLAAAVKPLEPKITACAVEHGVTGSVAIKMEIQPEGRLAWAAVREGGEAFQSCVNKVLREMRVRASKDGGTLVQTVKLPDP